jgi:hypothetical protein
MKIFKKNYPKILRSIIALCSILCIIAIWQIAQGNITGFEPLFFGFGSLLFGAFNWADMLVFSLLWLILSLILLRLQKTIYFGIAYLSFWLIRSSGEVLFSMLQQFNPHTRPWLLYMPRAILQQTFLGKFILVRYWVVEQIFFQSIAVISLFGLLVLVVKLIKEK